MAKEKRRDKVNGILNSALAILARNGYENTTINDIADSAKISRGLLHYYFKDKEDLAAQALAFGFATMWDMSFESLSKSRSGDDLVDNMIEILKRNVQENPDFTALLFEMWVSSRRSNKIRKVFNDGMNEAIERLKRLFEFASSVGMIDVQRGEYEGTVRLLLAAYNGMAIQLLSDPEKINDKKMWVPIRKMLLIALGRTTTAKRN